MPAILLVLVTLLSLSPIAVHAGETVLFFSDPRPGLFWPDGETALTEDFDQAPLQMPPGWTLTCVQNVGDVDSVSLPVAPYYFTVDSAYAASALDGIPHFMCVGNHEAETAQDMIDIRNKFAGYPDWNLTPGPAYTSETTYSYDVGDMHIVVVNQYWDGQFDDTWMRYGGSNGGYIPEALFEWVKQDLRNSDQPFKLVLGHESGYPVGRHVGDSLDQDPANRDKYFNLLRTERVFAHVSAHTHTYALSEHDGLFEVNAGVCGAHVGKATNDVFSTLSYAHSDVEGFQMRMVREDPLLGWPSSNVTTITRSDLGTQVLVNTAEGAGTVCRYFVDYTAVAQPINPNWTAYGPWWEGSFDDVLTGWQDGELTVGYDITNPGGWGWINEPFDPDPTGSGGAQVHAAFVRIPFTVHDKAEYPFMKLSVDYDDALTVWLNGTKTYESSRSPTVSSTSYWDKVATGSHEAGGDAELNPEYTTLDVSHFVWALQEGENLLAIGNWNRAPGSSDLAAGVKLSLTKAVVLVEAGASWRYDDSGIDLGIGWRGPPYDDTGWSVGPAQLGYGDGDESTVLDYGTDPANKYPCYYFRHAFHVSDVDNYEKLKIRLMRDDGAVVYLNGVEVFRSNMPSGEVTYATLATFAAGGSQESGWYEQELGVSGLVDGTNTIAVEIHQAGPASSDVSFDLALTAFVSDRPPTPDVKADGQDDPVILNQGQSAEMSIALDPAGRTGQLCDWWIGLISSYGVFPIFEHPIPLMVLPETSLFDSPLPPGVWYWFFILDDQANGSLDQVTWFDYAVVGVIPGP